MPEGNPDARNTQRLTLRTIAAWVCEREADLLRDLTHVPLHRKQIEYLIDEECTLILAMQTDRQKRARGVIYDSINPCLPYHHQDFIATDKAWAQLPALVDRDEGFYSWETSSVLQILTDDVTMIKLDSDSCATQWKQLVANTVESFRGSAELNLLPVLECIFAATDPVLSPAAVKVWESVEEQLDRFATDCVLARGRTFLNRVISGNSYVAKESLLLLGTVNSMPRLAAFGRGFL